MTDEQRDELLKRMAAHQAAMGRLAIAIAGGLGRAEEKVLTDLEEQADYLDWLVEDAYKL